MAKISAKKLPGHFWIHVPGSLQVPAAFAGTGVPSSIFLYFSFTTLTTTGYGEILPANALTRTLVIIEQFDWCSLPGCAHRKAGIACSGKYCNNRKWQKIRNRESKKSCFTPTPQGRFRGN